MSQTVAMSQTVVMSQTGDMKRLGYKAYRVINGYCFDRDYGYECDSSYCFELDLGDGPGCVIESDLDEQ